MEKQIFSSINSSEAGLSYKYSKFNIIQFLLPSILIAIVLYLISINNYLLFHSLAEFFSIIISCAVFMVIWNSRRYINNNFFIIVGIAYLFISMMDLIHTFTYKGVNIIPGTTANLPTQIWIASRLMQSITLMLAPFFIGKKIKTSNVFYLYLFIFSILLASVFYWKIFPQCYVEGYGLTPFKKISEYFISLVLLASLFTLYKKKKNFDASLFHLIDASIIVTILSELNFTLYISVYGFFNFLGHLLKIISFYLIYRAIIVAGLQNPFNILFGRLKEKEEDLRLTRFSVDHSGEFIFWINREGYITDVNEYTILRLNYLKEDIVGAPFSGIDPHFDLGTLKSRSNKSLTAEHIFKTKEQNIILVEIEFNYLEYERKNYYCAFARDITQRKKAEEVLLESEARFRSLADNAPVMIWMSDSNKLRIYSNRRWLEFTGNTLEQENGNGWLDSIHPEDRMAAWEKYNISFNERTEFNIEYRLTRFDGQFRWVLDFGIPRFTTEGNFLGYIGSSYDITERRKSSEQMKLSLSEKVTLLKEIHHRVKNNLQVISSMLRLQSSYIKDTETRDIFIESQNRIRSMALIHEKLYLSKDLTHINFSDYIYELVSSLLSSFRYSSNNINLDINIEDIKINVDLALNLGLIINELVSNTFKYAFPDGLSREHGICELHIKLKSLNDSKFMLVVKDNGIGLPSNIDFQDTDTLGLQIVSALVKQHKGSIELNNEKGAEYSIIFNL